VEEELRYYEVVLDGIDKTGKDLISHYVFLLSKKRYLCRSRGIMSMIAYNYVYGRPYVYDLNEKRTLNVLLTVDKEDWKIRCDANNEPLIDFETDSAEFERAYKILNDYGFETLRFDTSAETPYQIAKQIVARMAQLNSGGDDLGHI